MTREISPPRDR
jgi:hypothetical protein